MYGGITTSGNNNKIINNTDIAVDNNQWGTADVGISCGSSNSIVSDNIISGMDSTGISVTGKNVTITNNIVTGNGFYGSTMEESGGISIDSQGKSTFTVTLLLAIMVLESNSATNAMTHWFTITI